MIVDCHAHIFEDWSGPCGHPSRDEHLKYLQRGLARTTGRTFRARDGAPADTKALLNPADLSWKGLNEVAFRVGRFGQLEFNADGEDYLIQYMPVGMQRLEASPDSMIAHMRYAGVDHAVLQAGNLYGAMTGYNTFAQSQHPGAFTALGHINESTADSAEALRALEESAARGLKGVYFNFEGFSRDGYKLTLEADELDPFWAKIEELKLVLCIEINAAPAYDKAGYLKNMRALAQILDRHRGIICHLAMGIPIQFFGGKTGWDLPDELERLYARDEVYMELTIPITWGGRWDYPYREAHPLIEDSRNRFGAEKLLWGSDMPNVERFCTYPQSLGYLKRYCGFLSQSDKDKILGANAARLYRIPSGH